MGEGVLKGGEVMELWVMVVQYACAAAGAAAVVRLVDGCGKGAKKERPRGGARKRSDGTRRNALREQYQYNRLFDVRKG